MAAIVGSNINSSDTAVLSSGIALNATTSTTILAAGDDREIRIILTNDGSKDAFIKLQAASVDNDKKGFILYKNTTTDLSDALTNFTGEISGITDTGSTTIFVTSF